MLSHYHVLLAVSFNQATVPHRLLSAVKKDKKHPLLDVPDLSHVTRVPPAPFVNVYFSLQSTRRA